jgi:cytochrome b6-f complex iron-sulfur subunit
MSIKRRDFIGYFGLGWMASCFPIALAACSPTDSKSGTGNVNSSSTDGKTIATADGNPTVSYETVESSGAEDKKAKSTGAGGFKEIGTIANLDKDKQLKNKEVVVIRDDKNPKKLVAVSHKCTHQGCSVDWKADSGKFVCPCHAAEFDSSGKVLSGPAPTPLKSYQVKIVGDKVLIKA